MKNEKRQLTPISDLGEFGLIDRLTANFPQNHASTVFGPGDDAAVLKYGNKLTVVTTDMLAEGVHFDMMYFPLKHLGYKSVIANLSDIYAMNAIPKQIFVSLAISSKYTVEAMDELYEGIHHACKQYEVDLAGGDTTSSLKGLVISITAIGEGEEENMTYRSGASPGNLLCVSGELGGAYLGLQLLEREKQIFLESPEVAPDLEDQSYLVGRQLKPEARKDIIEFFRTSGIRPTSMIDISDGLSSEVMHICKASETGCRIYEGDVPIHADAYDMAIKFNLDPITCALSGGEDYELLFTIPKEDREKIMMDDRISIIGEMLDKNEGIKLHTRGGNVHDITAMGWNAFRKEK